MKRLILSVAAALAVAAPATAGKPLTEPNVIPPTTFPAGVVCEGFAVSVVADVNQQTVKTFFDREGNVVRQVITGRLVMTVSNADAPERSVTIRLGDAIHQIFNADGTMTVIGTGNVVLFWFPTDVPPGPSTTLYSGRIVLNVNTTTGVGTIVSTVGKSVDICALLAP